jgi:16S rRNA (cytosine967-C5)-methyltransferase
MLLLAELKVHEPHLGYSHPHWLCNRWLQQWGPEQLIQLLEWNNSPPPTFARLNTLRADAAQLTTLWSSEEVQFKERAWDWTGAGLVFELEMHPWLGQLSSFQQGWFYVQDPSTLLAVQELNPQPGETVLDLCAAPGGKTTFIAQRMANRGLLVAHDQNPQRLALALANCARLGVTCVETLTPTFNQKSKIKNQKFDRVLVDAPCSNTGVMRRRVELRWRLRPRELARLQATQRNLLDQAARFVRPGGTLVYSTCSLEAEENERVIQAFLSEHTNFGQENQRQLLPFIHGVDGAYVARLRPE